MYAIDVQSLEKQFSGDIKAVQGIDLTVSPGEIYGFLGPNGAGKTTTVRMLVTLLRPTSGKAFVAGKDIISDPQAVRRKIGVALQESALDPLMEGVELVQLQGRLHGLTKKAAADKAKEVIERVGLSDAQSRRVGTYSGGMRRRLDLAMSLVHEPEVLFLDEPTTGLDPTSRHALWNEVRRLREEGTTVFLTTQYLEEADELADRVSIINDGLIVAEGTPSKLKNEVSDPRLEFEVSESTPLDKVSSSLSSFGATTAGDTDQQFNLRLPGGSNEIAAVVRRLDENGVHVSSLNLVEPSLDDVFFIKTGQHIGQEDSSKTTK